MDKLRLLFFLLVICLTSCHNRKVSFFSYIDGETGISGTVSRDGAPMKDVEVYLYRSKKTNFRGPADFMDTTDEKGSYFIDVPDGSYYIIARKRKSGVGSGPIKEGDYYSKPIYEPVVVVEGRTAKVDLKLMQLFGSLIQKESGQKKTETYITGKVLNASNAPVKGAYAFAYKDGDFKREPDFFSGGTNEDGVFVLYFLSGGRYYLGARSAGRGIPKPGDLYGMYEGKRGSSIFIKNNEKITDVKIIIKEHK